MNDTMTPQPTQDTPRNTEGPFDRRSKSDGGKLTLGYGCALMGDRFILKADRAEVRTEPTERDANIAYAVHCWNMHSELVAALERVLARLESETASIETCDMSSGTELAIEQGRAALQKAKST